MSVFFFKQKTAYEMRISDWSSDVCSSDLSANWWRAGWRRRRAEDPLPARRRDRGRCCSWSPCFLRRHSLKRKVSVKRRPSVSYSSPLVCDGYTDARVGTIGGSTSNRLVTDAASSYDLPAVPKSQRSVRSV